MPVKDFIAIKKLALLFFLPVIIIICASFQQKNIAQFAEDSPIIGRWDLTVNMDGRIVPSWLEVKLSGHKTLVGAFVAEGGSARPVSKVSFENGQVRFTIPPQWENSDKDMVFEATLNNGRLTGNITSSTGNIYSFTGERAPLLTRTKPPVWEKPVLLLNGKNLTGWHADRSENQWMVTQDGILKSPKPGANLVTDRTFNDFKLHVEFRYPANGNSGVYLRGRYEVQVEDSYGKEPLSTRFGGVYGFLTPNEMAAKKPGEWQSFDITLVGRMVTVVANGKEIITRQNIPGITGGAINSNEGEPGPIMLQGDHAPVEYRNIIITPAK